MGIAELLLLGALAPAPAGPTTHTSLADVRDCAAVPDSDDWLLATEGGVARVNARGEVMAVLSASDGLPGTRTHRLVPDPDSRDHVWVAGERGVARVRTTHAGLEVEARWSSEFPVRDLQATDAGWVAGLWGGGLATFDAAHDERRDNHLRPLEAFGSARAAAKRVTSLKLDGDRLWVGTAGQGLWTGPADELGDLRPHDATRVDAFVWDIAGTGEQLRVASMGGVLDRRGHKLSAADVRALHVDEAGWLGASLGAGLVGADGPRAVPHVQSVTRDGERLCVGSPDGLWLAHAGEWTRHLDDGLPDQDIAAMARRAATGELWAGAFDGGLARYDGERWHRVPVEGLDSQINALHFDRTHDDWLWVGTARGLFRLELASMSLKHWSLKEGLPGTKVLSLAPGADGSLLVGTEAGPRRVVDDRVHDLGPRIRDWAVWAIAESTDETGSPQVWLGTTQGLIVWSPDRPWRHLSVLSGHLPDNWITSLVVGPQAIWVGTYAAGVTRLERGPRDWRAKHLGGGRINPKGLELTADGLLASTMEGLLRLRGETWTALGGLPGVDVTGTLSTDDGLWVSTRRGLQLR